MQSLFILTKQLWLQGIRLEGRENGSQEWLGQYWEILVKNVAAAFKLGQGGILKLHV